VIKDTHCVWRGNPPGEFGAFLAELEFQCLEPRRTLTELYTNASFFVHFLVVMEDRTGFLVALGDAPALAARIGTLLDSAAMRRAMGTAGRRVVVERFSLDAAARPFLQTYDELLAGAGDLCVALRAV
jgi:hypothetical protein